MEFSFEVSSADGKAMVKVRRVVRAIMRADECILALVAFEGQVMRVDVVLQFVSSVARGIIPFLEEHSYLDEGS
jgi:hypothetical protein